MAKNGEVSGFFADVQDKGFSPLKLLRSERTG
jgi:hypothetical protein